MSIILTIPRPHHRTNRLNIFRGLYLRQTWTFCLRHNLSYVSSFLSSVKLHLQVVLSYGKVMHPLHNFFIQFLNFGETLSNILSNSNLWSRYFKNQYFSYFKILIHFSSFKFIYLTNEEITFYFFNSLSAKNLMRINYVGALRTQCAPLPSGFSYPYSVKAPFYLSWRL